MTGSAWSTQQLAEFVAALSTADNEPSAARRAVERAAEALDADIAALVRDGELIAATGYPDGEAPLADLAAIKPGQRKPSRLEVPGVGVCAAVAAPLDDPPGARLVIARRAPDDLTPEEAGLLRGMGSVAAMRLRTLRLLEVERSAREELERLADEQAALRRVATLVARGVSPGSVFAAVAEEVGRIVPGADVSLVGRYAPERTLEFLAGWSSEGDAGFVGTHVKLGGRNVSTLVFEHGEPARTDYPADDNAPATLVARNWSRSSAGAPIRVQGELWGVVVVGSLDPSGLPPAIESRLADFTQLMASAIANAQAGEQLQRVAEEQAALRRVATLVARSAPPVAVFATVAEELGRLLSVDRAGVCRYNEDHTLTVMGGWSPTGESLQVGEPVPLGGNNAVTRVFETGRPTRIAYGAEDPNPATTAARDTGGRAAAGAPISVAGRLWGAAIVVTRGEQDLPLDTEARLADFAELIATAIANTEARDQLQRVAGDQAALRRVATLVALGAPATEIFEGVTEEIHLLLKADETGLSRYDADGLWTVLAIRGATTGSMPVGFRLDPGPSMPGVAELLSGRSVRVDASPHGTAVDDLIRAEHLRAWVASPIVLMGRTWGQLAVFSRQGPLPAGTEERLAGFTELLATAIANANATAELTASRARIVASADGMRRKIERDIHDGTQQRLVSLGLQVRAAQASVPADLGELAAELDAVAVGLENAFDELRELARGVHPAILAEGGLGPAIRALARRSTVPVKLDVPAIDRLPPAIEIAAYYAASEALANAAKHAEASVLRVSLEHRDGRLRLAVSDDGLGGAEPTAGTGLIGLIDRAAALGGTVSLDSPRGRGTSIVLELPVEPPAPPDREAQDQRQTGDAVGDQLEG